jgi:hypothetical protein
MASNDERYKRVAEVIHKYGKPNPQFPLDYDIEYSGALSVFAALLSPFFSQS